MENMVMSELNSVKFFNKEGVEFNDNSYKFATNRNRAIAVAIDDSASCAKIEEYSDGDFLYYVKRGTVGIHTGRFLNPFSSMSSARDHIAYDTKSGRAYFEYTKVKKEVFDFYMNYLQKRNPSYLLNAERRFLNDV